MTRFKNIDKLDQDELIYLHKLTIIERLLGDIVHEFNNKLGGIADGTRAALENGKLEVMKKTLEITLPIAVRGCSLTRTVADLARAKDTELEEVDVSQVLEGALNLRSYGLQNRGIQVIKDYDTTLPRIWFNSGGILQILLTMIMNAEESMENGGSLTISLSPFTEEKELEISFKYSTEAKFERKEVSLGLRAVQESVKQQGGRFHQEDNEKGSTFTLRLPLPEASSNAVEQAEGEREAPQEPPKKKLSVLIIEDEEVYRQFLTDLLKNEGHEPEAVADGYIATEKMKNKDYDLAFIDVNLPGKNGFELCALLKEINSCLKVIFVTGDSSEDMINKIKQAATLGYVTKPCKLKDIYSLLAKVG